MKSIAFYSAFLVAACAANPLAALPKKSSMTASVYEESEELPIVFASPFVKELYHYSFRFPNPNRYEVAFREALRTERRDIIRSFVECPICYTSMHQLSAATLKCGHVMHETCFTGEKRAPGATKGKWRPNAALSPFRLDLPPPEAETIPCPLCNNPGPHTLRTRKTVITKALEIFEQVGVIPPMEPNEGDFKRAQLWKLGGVKLRQRFVDTLRSLHSFMHAIFEFTLRQMRMHRFLNSRSTKPRLSRLFYKNRGGIDKATAKSRMSMLYQLRLLVERICTGLPEITEGEEEERRSGGVEEKPKFREIPPMPPSHLMSPPKVEEYIQQLFEVVENDFEAKLEKERTATPHHDLFSRWEDRIWWLQVLVRTLMNAMFENPMASQTSRAISVLFTSYVGELPYWTHSEAEIVKMEFPFGNSIKKDLLNVLDPNIGNAVATDIRSFGNSINKDLLNVLDPKIWNAVATDIRSA